MKRELFVVEDSDDDFESLERTCRTVGFQGTLTRFVDAEHALEDLRARRSDLSNARRLPGLILLDLNLPGMDGRELLAMLKGDPVLKIVPVVVLTTSSTDTDLMFCHQNHVNAYQLKPMSLDDLEADVRCLVEYWFETVLSPLAPAPS